MRIVQLIPNLKYGDAVGNDTLALHHILKQHGYETRIYAEYILSPIDGNVVTTINDLPYLNEDDIIFYHFSTGSETMVKILQNCNCRKIMAYHNITPAKYFTEYDKIVAQLCDSGRKELCDLKTQFECCIADSEYNKNELIDMGYTCPIYVLPIIIPFKDYEKEPEPVIIKRYGQGDYINILFVGRIVPNKKIENVIRVFAWYNKHINSKSRLFLVGDDKVIDSYTSRLKRYIKRLGLTGNIYFSGHIPFNHILGYYRVADVFLCMSEHEGFCVPLAEAMKFSVPIVSYAAAAVPETLNGAGIILKTDDITIAARMLDVVIKDSNLNQLLLRAEENRLNDFAYNNIRNEFLYIVDSLRKNIKYKTPVKNSSIGNSDSILNYIDKKYYFTPDFNDIPQFEDISVKPTFLELFSEGVGFKKLIKILLLKPVYQQVYKVSPTCAVYIRNSIKNIYRLLTVNFFNAFKGIKNKPKTILRRTTPNVLVDTTYTTDNDLGTGIQRVVNNIFKNLENIRNDVLSFRIDCGVGTTNFLYTARIHGMLSDKPEERIVFINGDKLLLLDSSWEFYKDFTKVLDSAAKSSTGSFAIIYDLFPIQYPELFDSHSFISIFRNWHNMVLKKTDAVLCISQTTADVVIKYYSNANIKRNRSLNVFYFHMGSNIPAGNMFARESICRFIKRKTTFLMVGTLEPRKGHMVVLQAFEKLIKDYKQDCQLFIIGHDGWNNNDIRQKLEIPELKDSVLWIQDGCDEELRWAYANSSALIAASKDEGFGLPLVEAAHFGLPIICSDIPIFREVTQGNADYFKAMDADDLARCMSKWLQTEKHPDSSNIRIYTWQESAQEILDIIDGKVEPYKVLL